MTELKIGDAVYGSFGRYGRTDVREGKVVKITPSSQVVADFNEVAWSDTGKRRMRRFRGGYEIGGEQFHSIFLIDAETYDRLSIKQRIERARDKVLLIAGRIHSSMPNSEIIASLREALALAETLPQSEGKGERP